jgi:EAL domain-containing protein (putative c-di-GMP-specific phosphodiesterase class I)
MVSPADFIPLAEEVGLIVPIGEWVLRAACAEAAGWPEGIKVAVNLSPAQFKTGKLTRTVTEALAAARLQPSQLEVEITESVLLQEDASNLAVLHELRALGIRISLDDFGTGYSSLSYLRSFPFDKIKIDQSFVRELSSRTECVAIVGAMAGLGRTLGMTTVAEGVETEEQLERVRLAGCTEVQGYLFSPPRRAGELKPFLGKAAEMSRVEQRLQG